MSKFKVGDVVQFTEYYINGYKVNDWWKDYHLSWEDVTGRYIVKELRGTSVHVHPINHPRIILIFFDHKLKLAVSQSKEELIISKIKYLDNRFSEKKHVKV